MRMLGGRATDPARDGATKGPVEFLCAHCGNRSWVLRTIDHKAITVECLSCGEEAALDRTATDPLPPIMLEIC